MGQAERFNAILDRLARDGSVGAAAMALELGVSVPTVRRDLQRLEEQHLLTRTHGGAVAHDVSYELPLRYRSARHHEQKSRIAAAAAALLGDARSIGLTGGTTTTEVARALSDRHGLTIVTNALNIASDLAVRPNIKLVVTGGVARAESFELVGSLAEATLAGLHLDAAVIGADGVDLAAGLTTHHEVEAHTNRALIASARRTLAVADASKIGRTAFASICPLAMVDVLITDATASPEAVAALRDAGLEVVLA